MTANKQDAAELAIKLKHIALDRCREISDVIEIAETALKNLAEAEDKIKSISQNAGAVDVEALKDKSENFTDFGKGQTFGWNACIDHLASRGLIKSQEGAGDDSCSGCRGFTVHHTCADGKPNAYAALSQPQRVGVDERLLKRLDADIEFLESTYAVSHTPGDNRSIDYEFGNHELTLGDLKSIYAHLKAAPKDGEGE